jgi:hypothetical protein
MGWTFTNKSSSVKVADFFKAEWKDTIFHAVKVINMQEVYMACSNKREPDTIFAVVCLLNYQPKEYMNFGYKDMDESMHPYYYNCPESILKLLSPTDKQNAIAWRAECQKRIDNKKSKAKFTKGSIIRFSKPIQFNSNLNIDAFRVSSMKPMRFLNASHYGDYHLYRLPKWVFEKNEYTVSIV